MERIVACGDHDTAVKIFRTHHVGNAGSRSYMEQIGVRAGSRDAGHQSVLKHVAAPSCVLADNDLRLVVSAIIPAHITSHLKRMIHSKLHISLAAETVGSKIFTHNKNPPFVIFILCPQALFC